MICYQINVIFRFQREIVGLAHASTKGARSFKLSEKEAEVKCTAQRSKEMIEKLVQTQELLAKKIELYKEKQR